MTRRLDGVELAGAKAGKTRTTPGRRGNGAEECEAEVERAMCRSRRSPMTRQDLRGHPLLRSKWHALYKSCVGALTH